MKGKERCKILKEIRARIAKENSIELAVSECTHKGDCLGSCPKCEAEVRYLERELERKRKLGKSVAVAGIAAGITLTSIGCSYVEEKLGGETLQGDMQIEEQIELDGIMPETEKEEEECVVETVGELAEEEEEILMGEPVAYPFPATPEELEGMDEEYIHELFTNQYIFINDFYNSWGEPDMTQKKDNEVTIAYFTDLYDVVIRFNPETNIITTAELIENE